VGELKYRELNEQAVTVYRDAGRGPDGYRNDDPRRWKIAVRGEATWWMESRLRVRSVRAWQ
jgi:hypothetical protein